MKDRGRFAALLDPATLGAAMIEVGQAQAVVTAAGGSVTTDQTAALVAAQQALAALTAPV